MTDRHFVLVRTSAMVLVGSMLAGCGIDPNKSLGENFETAKENLSSMTALQACVGGAVLGGLAGYILSGGDAKAAVAGGFAGGFVGCTAGATLNARRAEYASEAAFFDNQLAVARQTNIQLVEYRDDLNDLIEANGAKLDDLSTRLSNASLDAEAATSEYETVGQEYADAQEKLRLAKLELDVQQQALGEHAANPQGDVDQGTIRELSDEVTTMEGYVGELETRVEALGKQRDAIGQFG